MCFCQDNNSIIIKIWNNTNRLKFKIGYNKDI